jgi:hypothetical protein
MPLEEHARGTSPIGRKAMPVETPSLFAEVIKDHLALKEQNSELDRHMPIDRYKNEDPFQNHPLFKTEEQARLEETMDGTTPEIVAHAVGTSSAHTSSVHTSSVRTSSVGASSVDTSLPWPGEETAESAAPPAAEIEDSGFWAVDRARDFDWGD